MVRRKVWALCGFVTLNWLTLNRVGAGLCRLKHSAMHTHAAAAAASQKIYTVGMKRSCHVQNKPIITKGLPLFWCREVISKFPWTKFASPIFLYILEVNGWAETLKTLIICLKLRWLRRNQTFVTNSLIFSPENFLIELKYDEICMTLASVIIFFCK